MTANKMNIGNGKFVIRKISASALSVSTIRGGEDCITVPYPPRNPPPYTGGPNPPDIYTICF